MAFGKQLFWVLLSTLILSGCGGSGNSAATSSAVSQRTITTLAHLASYNVSLSNGRVYFSNSTTREIKSVAVSGGPIATHYHSNFDNFSQAIHQGNQIYALESSTGGKFASFSDTSEDVTSLSATQTNSSSTVDVLTDGNYVYWSEYDVTSFSSHVVKVPVIPTGQSPISPNGASTDLLVNFSLTGVARIAMDGTNLFVLEGNTGNLYKVDLSNRQVSTIALAVVPVSVYPTPLVVAGGYLYALANNETVLKIDETTGATLVIATALAGSALKSDGNAVYWLESQPVGVIGSVFRSYTSETGHFANIASTVSYVYDFCIVGGQLWWLEAGDTLALSLTVQKVPVTGGMPVVVSSFANTINGNTNAFTYPYSVVGDSTNLYWICAAGILTMPQSGGAPAIVTENIYSRPFNYSLTLTNSSIIWGQSGYTGIQKISKAPQPVTPTVISQATFPTMPASLTSDTSSFYWTVVNAGTSTIVSWSYPSGPINNLGAFSGDVTRVFPHRTDLVLVKQTGYGYLISATPTSGGAEVELLNMASNLDSIPDVFVVNDVLYFTSSNVITGAGGVYAVDLNTGSQSTIASNVPYPNHLYVDQSKIYWSTFGPLGGGIYGKPLSGGTIESIFYSSYGCGDITGDSNRIYWACEDISSSGK